MRDNTILALAAVVLLGLYALLPWGDQSSRSVALGALAGLVGGHLNAARPKSPPE